MGRVQKDNLPPERYQHVLDQQQHTAWTLAACGVLRKPCCRFSALPEGLKNDVAHIRQGKREHLQTAWSCCSAAAAANVQNGRLRVLSAAATASTPSSARADLVPLIQHALLTVQGRGKMQLPQQACRMRCRGQLVCSSMQVQCRGTGIMGISIRHPDSTSRRGTITGGDERT